MWVEGNRKECNTLERKFVKKQPCQGCRHKVLCEAPADISVQTRRRYCRKGWTIIFDRTVQSRKYKEGKIYNYHFKETVCYKVFDEPVEYKNAAKLCNVTEGVFSTDPKLPRPIELSKSNLNPLRKILAENSRNTPVWIGADWMRCTALDKDKNHL